MQATPSHSAPYAKAQSLITDLHNAFAYTGDNNRDLISDTSFPFASVIEELEVEKAYQFLIAYIQRNIEMVNSELESA